MYLKIKITNKWDIYSCICNFGYIHAPMSHRVTLQKKQKMVVQPMFNTPFVS